MKTPTEKSKEIVVLEKKTDRALQVAQNLVVTSGGEMLKAGEFRKEIKNIAKNAKEEKERATKPLNEVLKTIIGWFAPIEENCETVVEMIDERMLKYQSVMDAKRQKAEDEARVKQEEIQKELDKGKISEIEAVKAIEKTETKLEKAPEAIKSSSDFYTRVDRKVKFTEPAQLSEKDSRALIVGGYLVWNEVKGRKDALSGVLTTGVEVYEQKSLI